MAAGISDPPLRTPLSSLTSSDDVYQLTMEWMARCQCVQSFEPVSYPKRLVYLEGSIVRLVERNDQAIGQPYSAARGHHYVTLSHCWGSNISDAHNRAKLTLNNIQERRRNGIDLNTLPRTFKHAILFASRLPNVGYIWIDILCIIQGDTTDWLEQSAHMDQVYRDAFLNISATAASNSGEGLTFHRKPELLFENEVILNIAGLPGANALLQDPAFQSSGIDKVNSETSDTTHLQPMPHVPHVPAIMMSLSERIIKSSLVLWVWSHLLILSHVLPTRLLHFFRRQRIRLESLLVKFTTSPLVLRICSYLSIIFYFVPAPVLSLLTTQADYIFHPSSDENQPLLPAARQGKLPNKDSHAPKHPDLEPNTLRRCTILDISFWADRVDNAPVNRRAWVLQERLMAPRVLHFCRDRVAWECREFEAAEGLPSGIPNYVVTTDGGVQARHRVKALDDVAEGKRLLMERFQDVGSRHHRQPGTYHLALWLQIVQIYAATALTDPNDKLIALAGMARWMSSKMSSPRSLDSSPTTPPSHPTNPFPEYIAGLFPLHLASQLLWYVEPTYHADTQSFTHHAFSPPTYRAPSFSWASIDAQGTRYPDPTDSGILITIESVSVTPTRGSDTFGLLDAAHMVLVGLVFAARVGARPGGRYVCRLWDERRGWYGYGGQHGIVFLDCPARDGEGVLGHDKGVCVVPAKREVRRGGYVTCLMLMKDVGQGVYRRIGVLVLSPYADREAVDRLGKMVEAGEGRQRILLI
jgi:hypothetical protein